MLFLLLGLFIFTDSYSQKQKSSYRKRASKAKIVLMNGEIESGILFSFSENSITYLPGLSRAKDIDWENRQMKEIHARDIQRISLRKQDRFLVSLATGTSIGLAGDIISHKPSPGRRFSPYIPSSEPEKKGPRIPIVSDIPKVFTGAVLSAFIGIMPFVINFRGIEAFTPQQLNKLQRHTLVRPRIPQK